MVFVKSSSVFSFASSGVSAKRIPPAFPLPPLNTCDFTATGFPISRAFSSASSGVCAR